MLADTADGYLYPCHRFVGMKAFRIGENNVIWPQKIYGIYKQLQDLYSQNCGKCWARALCDGLCPHYMAKPEGDFKLPDLNDCEKSRNGYEEMIWVWIRIRERFPYEAGRLGNGHF